MNHPTQNRPAIAPLETIQRQISRAERDLIDQRTQLDDEDGMAVLFTGNHHDAFPRHLVVNNYLSPTEKTTWQVIRLSIVDPNRPGATPRRNDIAAMVNCSPPTVTSSKTMLRIRGWLTYCRSVRQSGRFVGDIYLLNDEPMTLQSTLEIDSTFIEFLETQIGSRNQRLKIAAAQVLQEIRNIVTGIPPTEIDLMGTRVERAMGNSAHQSKIFATVKTENYAQTGANKPNSSTYSGQSKNFATDEGHPILHQRKKFAVASKNISTTEKKNSCSPGSSSSFNINKYISNARVHSNADQAKTTPEETQDQHAWESLENYTQIQRQGRWGDYDSDRHNAWLQKYLPWLTHKPLEIYVMWLFSGRNNLLPVIWQKIKPLPRHSQELVVYQLLGHAAAWMHGWREPIRDPVAYLHRLVELQIMNRLYPDEWSLKLKRCVDEGEELDFKDSPELKAWRQINQD